MIEIKTHPVNPIVPRTPLYLSEDQRLRIHAQSDAPHAVVSPPLHDRWWRSDRTALIAPRHLRALENLKKSISIRKIDF